MGEVELEEGDMLKSERVSELMKKADVVLINNKVFAQTREYTVVPFDGCGDTDLRSGCMQSMKPFAHHSSI
jgi:hypothetical protein